MSNRLGPLEISCDAPPYSVVCACRQVGFQSPEDVRWSRISQVLDVPADEWQAYKRQPWKLLLRMSQAAGPSCRCGQRLPGMDQYTFTYLAGNEVSYLLGQCNRCRTIYWEEG
jgi:hypothetical protein